MWVYVPVWVYNYNRYDIVRWFFLLSQRFKSAGAPSIKQQRFRKTAFTKACCMGADSTLLFYVVALVITNHDDDGV